MSNVNTPASHRPSQTRVASVLNLAHAATGLWLAFSLAAGWAHAQAPSHAAPSSAAQAALPARSAPATVAKLAATSLPHATDPGAAPSSTPFQNTIAQRMQACTTCHGLQGRAGPDGYYPRLAGKPAGYLYHQLRNFQQGRRHYGLMADLLEPLPDAYLRDIAEHFAQLDAPYPPPTPVPARDQALLQAGERLVRQGKPSAGVPACMACHGPRLLGIAPDTPGLLGLPKAYLTAQMGAWRTGQRQALAPDCMAQVVHNLSDAELNAAATWLAGQAVPAGAKPALEASTAVPARFRCGAAPQLKVAP